MKPIAFTMDIAEASTVRSSAATDAAAAAPPVPSADLTQPETSLHASSDAAPSASATDRLPVAEHQPKAISARASEAAPPAEEEQDRQVPAAPRAANRDRVHRPASPAVPDGKPQPGAVIPAAAAAVPVEKSTEGTRSAAPSWNERRKEEPTPAAAQLDQISRSEPRVERPAAAREFVIQLPSKLDQTVQVHLTEKAGRVRVTVRSSDARITTALRNDLGDLVRSLTSKGYQIDAWTPPDTYPFRDGLSANLTQNANTFAGESQHDGQGSRQQQPEWGAGEHSRDRSRERWLDELERRLEEE